MNRAIFFDRDGVICKEKNLFYKGFRITEPEHFEWEDGVPEALKKFSGLDYLLVVVTTQSQIGRGLMSTEKLSMINKPIYDELKKYNRTLDGFYFCPHVPQDNCDCRKPKIGLMLRAKNDLSIDLENSWMMGDTTSDILAGNIARCKTILVKTGYAGRDGQFSIEPDFTAESLLNAYNTIVKNGK
jgi:D,D-heptose 1,7-bisphosphate phosphatase